MTRYRLYTIGHSNHPLEHFIGLLQQHDIELLADVRSVPMSRRNPQYNKKALDRTLAEQGIQYVFLGKELGARRDEPEVYENGTVSYDLVAKLPIFHQGLDWLRNNIRNHRIAIMCAEKEPLHCHRTLLVCRHLRDDIDIWHILADGVLESQNELERLLVDQQGLMVRQRDLFDKGDDTHPVHIYRS